MKTKKYPLELRDSHIVQWLPPNKKYVYTIALFEHNRDGVDLRFIGRRPLEKSVDWAEFEKLARKGYKEQEKIYLEKKE